MPVIVMAIHVFEKQNSCTHPTMAQEVHRSPRCHCLLRDEGTGGGDIRFTRATSHDEKR